MRWGPIAVTLLAAASHSFGGHHWSLDVPPGYAEIAGPAAEQASITAFAPPPRDDGSRPGVQVSLIEVPSTPDPALIREKVAEEMIAGLQRRREEWHVEKSAAKVGGVDVIRYVWRGTAIPASDGASMRVPVRGVMLVGVVDTVAFVLQTQDVAEHADETLPSNEKALSTFRLAKRAQ